MRSILAALPLMVVLLTVSCSRVQEPWIRNVDQLGMERSRTVEEQQTLRHRLMWVQADR